MTTDKIWLASRSDGKHLLTDSFPDAVSFACHTDDGVEVYSDGTALVMSDEESNLYWLGDTGATSLFYIKHSDVYLGIVTTINL